jgi:predicted acetyltransferase
MEVSGLGMFDQGFYDKVGFGTGSYENWITFDPATLNVDYPFRPPKRITLDDYEQVHQAMASRRKGHGNVSLHSSQQMKAEMLWTKKSFGLGYYDGPNNSLSHFIWGEMKGEHGPYTISWRAHQTTDQLLELLTLIKSLGDQVHQIGMLEFGEIQVQDLLKQPFRTKRVTKSGPFEQSLNAIAYWQVRILDLNACLSKTHLNTPPLRFNLQLTDPVEEHLDEGSNWKGLSGDYVIELGAESSATSGQEQSLPTLTASVNAFSRLWLGVRPASSLAITDQLSAGNDLISALDESLRVPKPHLGWDF